MKHIGAHVSAENGVSSAPLNALEIGARSFALFTRNPSRWSSKPISDKEALKFKANCESAGYAPSMILPHDSYLINLGSPDPEKLTKSREAFDDEVSRCMQLGLTLLNFHPGSHLNMIEPEACLDRIAESLNISIAKSDNVKMVIENTAGQGSNLGFTFEQIARIIDRVEDKSRVGVCIDTCHAFAAGYDLSSAEGYEATWRDFDRIIGFNYLSAMHLNDSMRPLGSHIDRHAPLREGTLGTEFFVRMMNDPRLDNIPIILETPDPSKWKEEIEWLYSLVG